MQIQPFSVNDGEGIRTNIFMAGCPLRCRWCSNPEGFEQKELVGWHKRRCIGCGACVAACKNASAMLFVGAKVSHLALLPQGKVEAADRVRKMVMKMDELGFGSCTNTYACEAECPKQIKRQNIARLNRQWIGQLFGRDRNN